MNPEVAGLVVLARPLERHERQSAYEEHDLLCCYPCSSRAYQQTKRPAMLLAFRQKPSWSLCVLLARESASKARQVSINAISVVRLGRKAEEMRLGFESSMNRCPTVKANPMIVSTFSSNHRPAAVGLQDKLHPNLLQARVARRPELKPRVRRRERFQPAHEHVFLDVGQNWR